MLKYCALFSLCAGVSLAADFLTGQAAPLVLGQKTFTEQAPGVSQTLLGGVGGIAIANDTLFVADSNRTNFTPINNRVLLFKNISSALPGPLSKIPANAGRCPACLGTADV